MKEAEPVVTARRITRGWILKRKIAGVGLVVLLSAIDMALAESHKARCFHLFRKHTQSYAVFTFGIAFWSFVLALVLALIPFRGISYKHRYVFCALLLMCLMDLLYLLFFTGYALGCNP
jgi:hypothetical protein